MRSIPMRLALLIGVLLATAAAPATTRVQAGDERVLRIATLLPRSREAVRGIKKWNKDLAEKTSGGVKVRVYWGGVAGDEVTVLRKMKAGQLDGGTFSAVGLGQIVRSVQIFNAPGLIQNARQLDALRTHFEPKFNELFDKQGFHVAGWGEAGRLRLFSSKPIKKPSDLQQVRPWYWTIDPVFPTVLKLAGANGVKLGVPEVMGGLQTGMIDTVIASAAVVWALQWYPKMKYMTADSRGFIVGALVFKKEVWESLPPDMQEVAHETARARNEREREQARRRDSKAYKLLQKRSITPVQSDANAQWASLNAKARRKLVGRVYPGAMLDQAEQLLSKVDATPDKN